MTFPCFLYDLTEATPGEFHACAEFGGSRYYLASDQNASRLTDRAMTYKRLMPSIRIFIDDKRGCRVDGDGGTLKREYAEYRSAMKSADSTIAAMIARA